MELRQIRTFLVLAEELHFGRTAARLRVAQSAVSYALKGLEQELGVELLTRTKRKVALTAAGHSFLTQAAQSLHLLEQAASRASRAARGEEGRLALRFSFMSGITMLPRAVASFQVAYPQVEVQIEPGSSVEQLAAIRAGRCDIGFMPLKRDIAPLSSEIVELAPAVVLVSSYHRLAKRERIHLAELAQEKFVFLRSASEPQLHTFLHRRCAAAGFEPEIAFEIDQFELFLAMVASGVGIAVFSGLLRSLTFPGLVLVPLVPEILTGISAVWDPLTLSAAGRNFLAMLAKERAPQTTRAERRARPASRGRKTPRRAQPK
jgi:DNA-binding transcriptional LysR family regulator